MKLQWASSTLDAQNISSSAPTSVNRRMYWASRLAESVDDHELRNANNTRLSTAWIADRAHLIPGSDYVQHVRALINALPTRVRTSRGQRGPNRSTHCRAECQRTETAAHVIQQCFRTYGGRIKRLDAFNNTLASFLREAGYTV